MLLLGKVVMGHTVTILEVVQCQFTKKIKHRELHFVERREMGTHTKLNLQHEYTTHCRPQT